MATTRIHPYHPLPAPVVHAGFSVSQSKSHVLAGVQDAYWSDDEAEDAECPLCLEEMDISDLNFKPCVCGYQVCRFCWHHIKENLNKRCPACRRIYTDEAVEFKPINTEDHKRLMQQKKQRDRERKELDALGRRHLANVRVVQRNVVFVVGIGPRFAKEELIPTLRSEDYFGKYGKISKILLVKRTFPGGRDPVVGLYITYHRREDAARAIAAVDGAASPSGGREIMRASYGTTKYCMAFLRGLNCNDHNCMNLHEWGDEKDCFTKEDLTTLKHTIKTMESRTRGAGAAGKKSEEQDAALPRAASWAAQKAAITMIHSGQVAQSGNVHGSGTSASNRQGRRGGPVRQSRNNLITVQAQGNDTRSSTGRLQDKKTANSTSTKAQSQASSSRPATPAITMSTQRPATPPDVRVLRTKKESPRLLPSPALSITADSDHWSSSQEITPSRIPSTSVGVQSSVPPTPAVPPGLPVVPPGLSAPPGIPTPSRPPRVESASPQTPLLSSQTSYQMSNAARALVDDVKARREAALPSSVNPSPFPDFDRTLQTLSRGDDGGFSFNLDLKLAGEGREQLPIFEDEMDIPFHGSYTDSFSSLRAPVSHHPASFATPGLAYPQYQNHPMFDSLNTGSPSITPVERQPSSASSYMGSFNPFSDSNDDTISTSANQRSVLDDDTGRKMSRFGFARGRRGSITTSSPLHSSSPMSASNGENHSLFTPGDSYQASSQWTLPSRQDYAYSHPGSTVGSPLVQLAQPQNITSSQAQARFQPFESPDLNINTSLSEAQLRKFIETSREYANFQVNSTKQDNSVKLPFNDPAIMSASLGASPFLGNGYTSVAYAPPPGLAIPPGLSDNATLPSAYSSEATNVVDVRGSVNETPGSSLDPPDALSNIDFPALTANTTEEQLFASDSPSNQQDAKAVEKAERKAAKKLAAAERAAERQRVAQERAALKAAERAKAAQEKVLEKERLAILKAEQERAEREKAQKEKDEKERRKAGTEHLAEVEKAKTVARESGKSETRKGSVKSSDGQRPIKRPEPISFVTKDARQGFASKAQHSAIPVEPAPLLSKKPKKNKPVAKVTRVTKEGESAQEEAPASAPLDSEVHQIPAVNVTTNTSASHSHLLDRNSPTPLEEIFDEIDICYPWMDLINHPFFDLNKVNPAAKMPLEYGPLVHALSALSVGGGSFANNMPSGSIDNAVSSFQQLLETLTQTISDLLRLLPRTTWDDSSSFDGVLRDMLKGDDFLDDAGDEGQSKEDEVVALTLALERRARWMEVQLSKLEELHRDINMAAVRAVLSFNDNGWDRHGFLPRIGTTLRRYDNIGLIEENGALRPMTIDELEKKLIVAKEAVVFAETEVREAMMKMQTFKPLTDYY
ncbi:hypothetical protein AX17_003513 [Amanita inopinata Kibby_2008]|nr:hypothetical protein AX17_003513 [Amanita inopinata Kibby_2008]